MARVPKWLNGEAKNYADAEFCKRVLSDNARTACGMRTVAEEEAWARDYLRRVGKLHLLEPKTTGD